MKKVLIFVLCACMGAVCLYGCKMGNNGETTEDYLNELQNTYSPTEMTEEKDELFPMPSSISTQVYITNEENSVIHDRTMTYAGEPMKYKLITSICQEKGDGPRQFNRVFFILVDGYLQPFYFEGSDKPVLYASISQESSDDLEDYEFSFEPIYVPYGENASLNFVISSAPVYYQEKSSEMVYNDVQSCDYCLTAISPEYAADYEKAELPADAQSDYTPSGKETNGLFVLSEKLESAEQLDVNTLLETDKQLYASIIGGRTLTEEDSDIRLYCVVDGELAMIFNNNYYTDLSMESMVSYQIPLDMDKLSKNEKHQIYFIEVNKNDIESFRNLGEDEFMRFPVGGGLMLTYCVTIK